MQYKVGTVNVTNGSPNVVGVGTEFVANINAGDFFIRVGDLPVYDVASVTDDTNLVLTGNYAGVTGSAVLYTIHRDFTSDNIPLMSAGDIETDKVFTRAMNKIQTLMTTGISQLAEHIIPIIYDGETGLVVYDGLVPGKATQVNAISIYAKDAPLTTALIFKLLRDSVEEPSSDATLAVSTNHQKTVLGTPITFTTAERIGLKCTQADASDPGSGIIITLHIQ